MSKYLKIGQVSKTKNMTAKALRFYDKVDLLKPSKIDESTNYRYYSIEQLFKIEMIGFLRGLGISIAEIKALFVDRDLNIWRNFFSDTIKDSKLQITSLELSINKMQKFIEHIKYIESIKNKKTIYSRTFPKRIVITRDCHFHPSSKEGIEQFQEIYYELSKLVLEKNIMTSYQTGSILSMPSSHDKFIREKIFISVYNAKNINLANLATIPKGQYLCINHKWTDFEDKQEVLKCYLKKNNLNPKIIIEQEAFLDFCDYGNPLAILQILA